jgi:hypothetical protein
VPLHCLLDDSDSCNALKCIYMGGSGPSREVLNTIVEGVKSGAPCLHPHRLRACVRAYKPNTCKLVALYLCVCARADARTHASTQT